MKTRRNHKYGVSLIVLVITVIVMIILAGAVVLTLSNSGIISKANNAVESTNLAQIKTQADMIWAEEYIEFRQGKITDQQFINKVNERLNIELKGTDSYEIEVTLNGVNVKEKGSIEWVELLTTPVTSEDGGALVSNEVIFVDGGTYRITLEGPEFSGTITSRAVLIDGTMEGAMYTLCQIQDGTAITWNTYKEYYNNMVESENVIQVTGIVEYGEGSAIMINDGYTIKKIELAKPKLVYKNETEEPIEGELTIKGLSIDRCYLIECEVEGIKFYFNQYMVAGSYIMWGNSEPISCYGLDSTILVIYKDTLDTLETALPITAIYDMGENMARIVSEAGFMVAETMFNRLTNEFRFGELLKTPEGDYTIPQSVGGILIENIQLESVRGNAVTFSHNLALHRTEISGPSKVIITKSAKELFEEQGGTFAGEIIDVTDLGDDVKIPSWLINNVETPTTIYVTKTAKETLYSQAENVIGVE